MAGVSKVEDLIAWQLAQSMKRAIYQLIRECPQASQDLRFRDQLRESAASVGMNIAEGFCRFRPKEFVRFLEIALASLMEASLWVHDGIDRGYFDEQQCQEIFRLVLECRRVTLGLVKSIKRSQRP